MANKDGFDPLREYLNNLARYAYEIGPDWPEALVNLIDALHDYINADEEIGDELLSEGAITRAQYDKGVAARLPMIMMLRRLEKHQFDPTLHGILQRSK